MNKWRRVHLKFFLKKSENKWNFALLKIEFTRRFSNTLNCCGDTQFTSCLCLSLFKFWAYFVLFLFSVQLKEITFQVLVPENVPGGVWTERIFFMKNSKSQPNPGLLFCKTLGTVWHYQLWSLKQKSDTT